MASARFNIRSHITYPLSNVTPEQFAPSRHINLHFVQLEISTRIGRSSPTDGGNASPNATMATRVRQDRDVMHRPLFLFKTQRRQRRHSSRCPHLEPIPPSPSRSLLVFSHPVTRLCFPPLHSRSLAHQHGQHTQESRSREYRRPPAPTRSISLRVIIQRVEAGCE